MNVLQYNNDHRRIVQQVLVRLPTHRNTKRFQDSTKVLPTLNIVKNIRLSRTNQLSSLPDLNLVNNRIQINHTISTRVSQLRRTSHRQHRIYRERHRENS